MRLIINVMNKKWPEQEKPVSFREITKPIKKAILFAYDIKRKNKRYSIPWKGLDIGEDSKVSCFSPDESLKYKNLKYSEREQGRDALDEIIGIAVQLGIEQGKRIFKKSIEYKMLELKSKIHNK